jgi:NitT/TauT family transport system substrate-binding protein
MIRKLLMAAALIAVAHGASAQQKPLDMSPVTVRYAGLQGVPLPTFVVADEKGFFKKQNLTLDITYLGSPAETAQALSADQIDLGHTAAISAALATLKGGKSTLLSGMEASFIDKSGHSWEAVYLIGRDGEGINSLQDLKGKRIGVAGFGSLYDYLLRWRVMEMGWDPAKDVTFIAVPYPQAAGALMQKEVEVTIAAMDGVVLAQSRGPIKVVSTHTGMEKSRVGYTAAVAASNEFLAKKPDVAVRFLRALVEARQWMSDALDKKDPEFPAMLAKAMKFGPDKIDFYMDTRAGYYNKDKDFINPLDLPKDLMATYVTALKTVGVLDKAADGSYDKIVNVSYLKRAYETLGVAWDESKH